VVADIRRIMASAAKAWNGFNIEDVDGLEELCGV
jgi:hypothetical protein